jgi:hypothetical protein
MSTNPGLWSDRSFFFGPGALFVSCFLSCTTRNTLLWSTLSQLLFLLLWGLKLENPKVESYFPGVDSLFVETFAKLRSRISDDFDVGLVNFEDFACQK